MSDEFALDPPPVPGQVPERVVAELREQYRRAADFSTAFADACKVQAEKYSIAPGALKRYVRALEGDKLEDVDKEAEDLLSLINGRPE